MECSTGQSTVWFQPPRGLNGTDDVGLARVGLAQLTALLIGAPVKEGGCEWFAALWFAAKAVVGRG